MGFPQFVARKLARSMAKDDAELKHGQKLPDGIAVTEYAYLDDGHAMHRLNVCRPEGAAGVLPLIVDIHGGAWVFGDKDLNLNMCMHLAKRGYVVAAPSYRLVPEVTLDGQVKDVFGALDFISKHAHEWGADASETMLTGDSAGGQLSSLALCISLTPSLAKAYGVTPPALGVKCLAMSHPVPEVHSILRDENDEPSRKFKVIQRVFDGAMFGKRPRKHPLYRRSAFSEYAEGLRLPPTMPKHSRYVARLLRAKEARGECDRFVFRYTDVAHEMTRLCHVYEVMDPTLPDSVATLDDMVKFFEESRDRT